MKPTKDQTPDTKDSSLVQLTTIRKKASPSDVRLSNRMMVFSQLFPHHVMSRADIVRNTGLSKASASEVVSDMVACHILAEIGQEPQEGRGKRGILLSIDARHWHIIAIDLSQPHVIQGAVTNLAGLVVQRAEIPVADMSHLSTQLVIDLCERLIALTSNPIMGIGAAVPGMVDRNGIVSNAPATGWSNVPLRAILEDRFHIDTVVDNNAHSALLAERFFGHGTPNTLFVQMTSDISAAILVDDSMIYGVGHYAGEIGHVTVSRNGPVCRCGKQGCLESMISVEVLRKRMAGENAERSSILSAAGSHLGDALSMTVNMLDIHDIVVFGPADIVNDAFLDALKQSLEEQSPLTCLMTSAFAAVNAETTFSSEDQAWPYRRPWSNVSNHNDMQTQGASIEHQHPRTGSVPETDRRVRRHGAVPCRRRDFRRRIRARAFDCATNRCSDSTTPRRAVERIRIAPASRDAFR